MFINTRDRLHPNIIKTAALIITERKLGTNSKAFKELYKLRLNRDSNALLEIVNVFRKFNVNDSAITEILNETSSLILSLPNPDYIIGEYIYCKEMREDIKRKVDSFNNNRNSYDLNSILNLFKDFILRYSVDKYDWDSDGLKSYLGSAYANYFSKDERQGVFIKEVLNNRGSVTKGNEGDISLSDKFSIENESKKVYNIDFPSICRDISVASDRLFNVSNVIVYDLFSYYRDESAKKSSEKIRNLFMKCFGSLEFSPTISEKSAVFGTSYTEKTVNVRLKMLDTIYNNVLNGLFSSEVYSIYNVVKSIDMQTVDSRNVATLFKHPSSNTSESKREAMEKYNKELFLEVLRGVKALLEFVKYLKYNNIEFSDSKLFRNLDNYKKFSTLDSYISFKELSDELGKSSDPNEFDLPYYDNDSLYNVLNGRYNLSSLSSIYNAEISKLYSPPSRAFEFKNKLSFLINTTVPVKVLIEELISEIELIDAPVVSEGAFNVFVNNVPGMLDLFNSYFDEKSSNYYLKEVILDTKNIFHLLRFFDFTLVIYDHLLDLIELLETPRYSLLMSDKLHLLSYPSDISSMSDLSKLKSSTFNLTFYENKSSEYMDDYYSISKFYSALFSIIKVHIADITDYIDSRISEVESDLSEYGIMVVEEVAFSNVKLRSRLITLNDKPENLTKDFVSFRNSFRVINGLLAEHGVPIVYEGFLVHYKGYLLSLASEFSITEITELQKFDLNKVRHWRDVLWKV